MNTRIPYSFKQQNSRLVKPKVDTMVLFGGGAFEQRAKGQLSKNETTKTKVADEGRCPSSSIENYFHE